MTTSNGSTIIVPQPTIGWKQPCLWLAKFTIKHIKRLCLSHVSKKVKSDFFKILLDYSKAKGNLVVFYIEPITSRLPNLMDDDEFNVKNFVTYHLSLPIVVPEHPSPLANLLEQGTPLTNNLSEHAKKDLSRQLQRIHVEHSGISLNRLLLMRKVYIKNWLLLLPILPRLHLWTLKWVLQLNNWRKDLIVLLAPFCQ